MDEELEELLASGSANEIEANARLSTRKRQESFVNETQRLFKPQKIFGANGKERQLIKATKVDWIHNLVYLDGKKFDFNGRNYLKQIYNLQHPHKLLKTGRQVEKSTMLANEFIVNSIVIPYFKSLYVSPSHDQTRTFSNQKLKPWMEDSPVIEKYFQNSQVSKQVFEKSFTNGSIGFLRSAFLNADRTRGISADQLFLDEIQDILVSNVPVITETLSHSEYGIKTFAGTPKTLENTIQQYWELSSQCEWLVPCACRTPVFWNFLDERNIGKNGPICQNCGKGINPSTGKWVSFDSSRDIMGYRISQIMVPWMYQNPQKWKELIWKLENLSKATFYNEVLGISYDSSNKPISRSDIIASCNPKYPYRPRADEWTRRTELFAGVDWGEGTDGSEHNEKGKIKPASYTVLTIGCYVDPVHFHYLYYRRFTGKDAHPEICIAEIIQIIKAFRCIAVGVDWGHGWGVNSRIESALSESRVMQFQHVGNQKQRKKYDDIGHKIQLARTEVMTDFITDLKDGKFILPPWEAIKGLTEDWEHIYAEYNESTRMMKYDHKLSEPDDGLHSAIYCKEAADVYYGKVR
jgi:hypothetical protein